MPAQSNALPAPGHAPLMQHIHEIRDPIHVFIRMDGDERKVLDSRPFQRLRHVHQLATTYLVYPGATHRRFEHSLGVMDLAGRVFDVVTNPDNVSEAIKSRLEHISRPDACAYWKRIIRMAALCHDIGHLPFSHAAEKELLPEGWDHERLTRELISSREMEEIWKSVTPPLRSEDIVKLAIGPQKADDLVFSDWESILSEIIVGDAFGVDRMDYLLRDSYHAGVAYGKFDHYRLIDTLRILQSPDTGEPSLGMEEGGLQSAEALMLARYFMYSQVYFHPVRRIYDIHLMDFLKQWLDNGVFSIDLDKHIALTDETIISALWNQSINKCAKGHLHAKRLVRRKHFKVIYQRNPADVAINQEAGEQVYRALKEEFGDNKFRHDRYNQKGGGPDFPVRMRDDRVVSSLVVSTALNQVPVVSVDYVFADRSCFLEAKGWLDYNLSKVIEPVKEENGGQS